MTAARVTAGQLMLSLLFVVVIAIGVLAGIFSAGFVPFISFIDSAPDEAWRGVAVPLLIVIGSPALVGVCLRTPAVRSRLLPGAVNISASAAILAAVAWTSLVMFGYADDGGNLWARLPLVFAVCSPLALLVICVLVISVRVSRDHRRTARPAAPPSATPLSATL